MVGTGCGSLRKGQCEWNTESKGPMQLCLDLSGAYKTPGDFLFNAGFGFTCLKWRLRAEALPERPPK